MLALSGRHQLAIDITYSLLKHDSPSEMYAVSSISHGSFKVYFHGFVKGRQRSLRGGMVGMGGEAGSCYDSDGGGNT